MPPSPPLNVRIVSSTDDTIFVSWDAPQFNGGRGGLIYGLYYQLDCDGCERVKYGVLNETSGVIKGMYNNIIVMAPCNVDNVCTQVYFHNRHM